jgi:8-oxo-dGTP pyrophosphatase MutT (NUDIX family)
MTVRNPWQRRGSKLIYSNPWITVREDDVITPGGTPGIYGVIETRVAVGVIALTDDNQIYLVGQYRYPVDEYSWEIPEGGAEIGEEPILAAKRELREETGLEAEAWEQLGGEVHVSNCFSAEKGLLYVARKLREGPAEPDHTEELQVKKVPFAECLAMVDSGEIKDGLTIIAVLRMARILGMGSR